jgi:hypothetical protein
MPNQPVPPSLIVSHPHAYPNLLRSACQLWRRRLVESHDHGLVLGPLH